MSIIFSEGSGLNDSAFGKCQAPIKMFLEKRGEAFEQKSMLKDLFVMGKSDNYGDLMTGMTAMNGFDPVGENGAYPSDTMQEGFQKLLVYETWKDSFSVSQEMVEDGKLLDLKKKPAQFIQAYHRTRENFGASLYGNAMMGKTSVAFRGKTFDLTGADGVSLFNKAHPCAVNKKLTQTNLFSNAFSVDALDRAEAAMHQFKGDNSEILDVAPTTIVIANDPALKRAVFAAIGADQDPDTANNGFNFQYGRWNVVIWNYLNQYVAGSSPWMLLDASYNELMGGAVWNDRIPLTVKSIIDEKTDANVWQGRARFNACFNDWRFACVGGIAGGTDLTTMSI